jgi:hypothetical protein
MTYTITIDDKDLLDLLNGLNLGRIQLERLGHVHLAVVLHHVWEDLMAQRDARKEGPMTKPPR